MLKRKAQLLEKTQHITIDQHRLYYRTVGSGPPLVLIHGYSNSGHIWYRVLPYLAQQHEVFILDLPGHGRSRTNGVWYLREMAPLLARLLEKLHLPPTAIMGHSMGGAIAIHLVAHMPEQFTRLVLVNAAGIPLQTPLTGLAVRSLKSFFQPGNGTMPLPLVRDILRMRIQLLWQSAQEMEISDFRAEIAQITLPTLIIWGEHDVLIPIALGHALNDALPHATFLTMPRCGHRPMLAQPMQFSKSVLAFLQSSTPG